MWSTPEQLMDDVEQMPFEQAFDTLYWLMSGDHREDFVGQLRRSDRLVSWLLQYSQQVAAAPLPSWAKPVKPVSAWRRVLALFAFTNQGRLGKLAWWLYKKLG